MKKHLGCLSMPGYQCYFVLHKLKPQTSVLYCKEASWDVHRHAKQCNIFCTWLIIVPGVIAQASFEHPRVLPKFLVQICRDFWSFVWACMQVFICVKLLFDDGKLRGLVGLGNLQTLDGVGWTRPLSFSKHDNNVWNEQFYISFHSLFCVVNISVKVHRLLSFLPVILRFGLVAHWRTST